MTDIIYLDGFDIETMPKMMKTTRVSEEPIGEATRANRVFRLLGVIVVAAAGYWAYDSLMASRHVHTDDAYVGANLADITPLIGGPVKDVLVNDTQFVRRGDVLVRLDDADARIALAKAQAQLVETERAVRGLAVANDGLAASSADGARASIQSAGAKTDLERALIDLSRRQSVAASSVSRDDLTSAVANVKAAQAALALAGPARAAVPASGPAGGAMIPDASVEAHPAVMAARAERDQARINLDRTVITAPIDGVVSRRDVQVGQRVQPGLVLMVVAPIAQAYVDANVREAQLARVRPGQPVTLVSDLYGERVKYHGRVAGISGETGAAFAGPTLLNATAAWFKGPQRSPVRIALDPKELARRPLQVGLSMAADIDIAR